MESISPALAGGLSVVINRDPSGAVEPGAVALVGLGGSPPVLGVTAVLPQLAFPQPLPIETLVEILKQPLCVGEVRRLVLDALGKRYQRHFATQWNFVRFAQERHLGLDFTSPPSRPEPLTASP